MSTRKTIQINPKLFNIKPNKSDKKRTKKEKPEFKETSLKRELMKRIKNHAIKKEGGSTNIGDTSDPLVDDRNDFDKHMNYLSNLSKDTKKEKRIKNKHTRKAAPTNSINTQQHRIIQPSAFLDLPPELNDSSYTINVQAGQQPSIQLNAPFQPEPPYGCLKGGGKPTFKDWKRKTQKNDSYYETSDVNIDMNEMRPEMMPEMMPERSIHPTNEGVPIIKSMMTYNDSNSASSSSVGSGIKSNVESGIESFSNMSPSILKINPLLNIRSERERKLDGVKEKFKKKNENDDINSTIQKVRAKKEPRRFKYNKTVKCTYGKSNGKITVCIKDSQTRKNVIQEQIELRKKPINEIKEYLKSKYLLKAGSHAPNDILRKIYEDVHLAGDIVNNNESNLLHNYMNDKETIH